MSGFEWFLLVVVVIVVPLVVAVVVTLWTLEQARQRNRKNREGGNSPNGDPVKRKATRDASVDTATPTVVTSPAATLDPAHAQPDSDRDDESTPVSEIQLLNDGPADANDRDVPPPVAPDPEPAGSLDTSMAWSSEGDSSNSSSSSGDADSSSGSSDSSGGGDSGGGSSE